MGVLIPEDLQGQVGSHSTLIAILGSGWHIFMLAGKDKPASCVLVGSGVNLMPFAGRVSHLGKTVNGNVGDPLTITLADEPVATVFGVGTDISNDFNEYHTREYSVYRPDGVSNTAHLPIIGNEGKIIIPSIGAGKS